MSRLAKQKSSISEGR